MANIDQVQRNGNGSEDVEHAPGKTFHGLEELRRVLKQHAGPASTAAPSRGTLTVLRRRYYRTATEVAQTLARVPTGSGKRLRGRIERAAEGFAELRELVTQMKAAERM